REVEFRAGRRRFTLAVTDCTSWTYLCCSRHLWRPPFSASSGAPNVYWPPTASGCCADASPSSSAPSPRTARAAGWAESPVGVVPPLRLLAQPLGRALDHGAAVGPQLAVLLQVM